MHKVLVVGIDGATWRLLLPWIKQGKLRNFKRFVDNGVSAKFNSTVPPLTPAAWTSILTGKNPGKHGIYHFTKVNENYIQGLYTSEDIKCPNIFDVLGNAGKKSIAINIPYTYPPKKINGIMISGMLTPSTDANFITPSSLKEEFLQKFPGYACDVNQSQYAGRDEEFIEAIMKSTKTRLDAVKHFMQNKEWDFFFFVLVGADRLQHSFMKDEEVMLKYYQYVDEELGKIKEIAGEKTNLFVISDHGFKPVDKDVFISRFLLENGWLKFDLKTNMLKSGISSFKKIFGTTALSKTVLLLKNYRKKMKNVDTHETMGVPTSKRFWKSTQLFPVMASLYVNDSRFDYGCVEDKDKLIHEIASKLIELKDPETGKKIIRKISFGREHNKGAYSRYGPDIEIETNKGYRINQNILYADKLISETNMQGEHETEGVFIAIGPDIEKDTRIKTISVTDFAPTVLHLMNLSIPEDMDGKVIKEVYRKFGKAYNNKIKIETENKEEKSKIKSIIKNSIVP